MISKQNIIKGLFLALTTCFCLFSSDSQAAEFQVGVGGATIGSSLNHDEANTVMPMAGVVLPLTDENFIKFEFGGFMYTLDKTGKKQSSSNDITLHKGELDVTGFSAAVIIMCPDEKRDVRLNFGLGAVAYQYKSSISDAAQEDLALNGITNVEEDLAGTIGFQVIVGLDFFLTENLMVGVSVRKIDVRPATSFSATYPNGSAVTKEDADLSHELLVLNVLYLFDF